MEKSSGDHLNYQSSGVVPPEWQFSNPSMGILPGSPIGSSPFPSVSMTESFTSGLWNQHHATNPQNLGLCQNSASSDLGWNPSEPVPKVPLFLQATPGDLPPSLSHIPADSAFIERAARFSCFNGGNLHGLVNPFVPSGSNSPYLSASKGLSGVQKSEVNVAESSKEVSMSSDHRSHSGSPMKNNREKGSLQIGASSNDPGDGDADVNGGGQEETSIGEPSCKAPIAKKRKRIIQDMELDRAQMPNENTKDEREAMKKTDQTNSTLASGKAAGKQPKDSSDAQKGDYIHVRARRGQATNSHSLAERVRREKISERMKFLQDLVPGCSKVTGKAVMLDEIINYVQSLQRQVEFLSMKLAAVNPRLDFNVEGILAKDLLQMRACSSSSIGFSQDMMHPQMHPSQHSLAHHAGISGLVNQPDATRRAVNAQFVPMNGFKEPTQHQMPNQWDDEYQNMSQMQFGANPPPVNAQELNAKSRDGFPM